MNRPLLGIGIGLVFLGLVAGAIAFTFRDDWRDDHDDEAVEYRVLDQSGQPTGSVVVINDDDRWDGPPPFVPFFPLVIIGGVLITIALVSRGRGRWHGPGGPGFEDWHRESHRSWSSATPNDAPPAPESKP